MEGIGCGVAGGGRKCAGIWAFSVGRRLYSAVRSNVVEYLNRRVSIQPLSRRRPHTQSEGFLSSGDTILVSLIL